MWAEMSFYAEGFLRLLGLMGKVIGIILALDVVGLSILQLCQGGWNPSALVCFLPEVLIGEAVVIAIVGCILLSGYSKSLVKTAFKILLYQKTLTEPDSQYA